MSSLEPNPTTLVGDLLIPGSPSAPSACADAPRWSLATRLAFRFGFLYLGLFILLNYLTVPEWMLFNVAPNTTEIVIGNLWPFRAVVSWVAKHIFHLTTANFISEYDASTWVQIFCILVVASVGTLLWSIRDRKRVSYPRLHVWFRVMVLVWLGATMFYYGAGKVVPAQMWFPRLSRLLERFGDFSPMAVLWSSIGASRSYEFFTGCVEIAGGLLLFMPRTTLLGALICAASMTNVFIMNMTYDVNVKGWSLHLILMAAFLLAPDAKRLMNLFLLNRPAQPSFRVPLFRSPSADRVAQTVILLVGVILLAAGLNLSVRYYGTVVAGTPPPLYGIWTVEDFSVDGQSRPPLITDNVRWRRVVFENIFPWARGQEIFQSGRFANAEEMLVYGMDEEPQENDTNDEPEREHGGVAIVNVGDGTLEVFTDFPDESAVFSLSYSQPAPDQLILDGVVRGRKIHAQMRMMDTSKFYLVTHANRLNWKGSGAYR
jgi:hypothetical protein